MRGMIALTDFDWFQFLAAQSDLDEVNFWRPSDTRTPRQLLPGMPLLFKLRKQHGGWIVGYGVFARHQVLKAELAWDAFGPKNGAPTIDEMLARIARLRPAGSSPTDYDIGCLMLSQPVFLRREAWIQPPADWPDNVVQGMAYELADGEGARVWTGVLAATAGQEPTEAYRAVIRNDGPRYGEPLLIRPRLGQGIFRSAVFGAYGGACTVTGEHSTPALEAAHIRPFSQDGPRDVTNGLLLRSDLHRLFDKGYVGVDQDLRFRVSDRLRADFSNGRSYYPLDGKQISLPESVAEHPDRAQLGWHHESVFRR